MTCADTLLDNLTVYEMLAYTAELKNPMKEPFEKKRAKVDMVIQQLGLNGCRGVRIGSVLARGISGQPECIICPRSRNAPFSRASPKCIMYQSVFFRITLSID